MVSHGNYIKLLLSWIVLMAFVTGNEAFWWRRRRRRRRSPPPDTTNPTFNDCPGNLGNQYTIGTSRTVTWDTPTARDNSGSVTVSRVSGLSSGSSFSVSTSSYTIQYRATDSAGNYAICNITFTVVGIRCSTLTACPHGSIECTDTNFISSVCTYSCVIGYRVDGSVTRRCYRWMNTGLWTGSEPSCERVTCSSLHHPTNGALTCTNGCYYDSTCTFSCNYGYTLQNSQPTRTCLHSGVWSGGGNVSVCTDTLPPTFTRCPGSQAVYSPPLATSATVTWSPPLVSDNSGETISVIREQGSAPGNTFEAGDQLIIYRATDSAGNSATCSFTITVTVLYCPSLSPDPPLLVSCSQGRISGSECTYSCSLGYSLLGQEIRECLEAESTGMWSGETPSCQILECDELPSLQNGQMTGQCNRNYGSSCYFECHTGYEINNYVLTCVAQPGSITVFWAGESPVCSRIYCTKPPLSTGLQITVTSDCPSGSQVPSGNLCHFLCLEGYHLQGSDDLTCQDNRSWSSTIPTCQLITCEVRQLIVPDNAVKQGCTAEQVNYGTVCTISCKEGYEATTSGEMTCSDDGSGGGAWSGDSIECTPVTCPIPIPESDVTTVSCSYSGESTVSSERQIYSTSCTFECADGYSIVDGSAVRVCLATGEWSGNLVLCRDITPPELICPVAIMLDVGPLMTSTAIPWSGWEPIVASDLGMSIEATLYSINSIEVGPYLPSSFSEGNHTLVYRAVDSSGNEADCSIAVVVKVYRCPPLSIPDRSIVVLVSGVGSCNGGVVYGSVCTIRCALGYTLSTGGSFLNRTCEISSSDQNPDGTWSGADPTCEVVRCDVPDVTNGLSDCHSSTATYLTSCTFSCTPGYRAPSGDDSYLRTCQADSRWSGEDFLCTEIITCPARFSIPYGSVTPSECSSSDSLQFNFTCEFTCDAGFRLDGPSTLICNTDGQWNQNGDITCVDIKAPTFDLPCPHVIEVDAPRARTNAEVSFQEPMPSDNSGVVTIARLDNEYSTGSVFPEGETRIRYQATDAFGLDSFCDVVITVNVQRCSFQVQPPQGSVTGCTDPFIGSECLYSCDVGYDLIGESTLHCELTPDGTPAWNDVTPTCRIQTCLPLQVPEFASLSGCDDSSVPYGSACTFSCPLGYTGIGESQKTCREEGVWSSTGFMCERLSCEALSETSSIAILPETCLSDPRFGDVCTVECKQSGFKIIPSSLHNVTCSRDQTWTGEVEQAQCVDLELPTFEDCPSDIIVFANRSLDRADVEWSVLAQDNDQSQEPAVTCNPQPGTFTLGEYVVRCSALDKAGNEASCDFSLEVKARQCVPLTPPPHGIAVGGCDIIYGSTCYIACSEGYILIGSSFGSCEFDGSDMFWQFEDEPLCKTTSCTPLDVPDPILFSPATCSGSDMVHDGTVCTMYCDFSLTLEGNQESFTCQKGEWNQQPDVPSVRCIDEVPPTITYCPSSIMTTRTEYWGVEESFSYPSAEDNFDTELQVNVDPPDLKSPYNFTSDTTCTYTFTDDARNSGSCVFQIDMMNEVQPVITSCPTGGEVNTSDIFGLVHYEKPSYLPMPGIDLVISCNTPDSPVTLPLGNHDIICHVIDPESGLQDECRMSFNVTLVACAPLNIPRNGALTCDAFANGRYCSILCEDGYDVPRVLSIGGGASTLEMFICGNSGLWYPQQIVPDCSEPMSSRHNLPLKIMYYRSPCSKDNASSIENIAIQFLQILEQSNFQAICVDNHLCSVDNVTVSCGIKNDRRRRSIHDDGTLPQSPNEGSNGPTTVSVVLQLTRMNKPSETDKSESPQPHQVLYNVAHHIHTHVKHHFSKADGEGSTNVIEDGTSKEAKLPEPTLLLGDVSVECDQGYYLDKDHYKCIPCPAGYYLDVRSDICTPCEQGFYQDEHAQIDCKPCRDGTSTSEKGATHPDQCTALCIPGHFSPTGLSPCMWCEQGSYQSLPGQRGCEKCPSGLTTPKYGGTSIEQCQEPCPAGTFSENGFHPCLLCPPGFYQPDTQRTSCRRCGGNTTTTMPGATSVKSCHIVH